MDLQVAQAVLMPLLVETTNVGITGQEAIQSMMLMSPPPDLQVHCFSQGAPDCPRSEN